MMKNYETLKYHQKEDVMEVVLNRPDIHNAFNETMIEEIRQFFISINEMTSVRVVVVRGEGKSFCAGADLNWMRDVSTYSYEQNLRESENLSACFYAIYTCQKPTIAIVHGAAIGGANGVLAACDIAVADDDAEFSLSEVKIGIVPACISPYIVKRIGESKSREMMITGQRFSGKVAKKIGLVNFSGNQEEVNNYVQKTIDSIRTSGPVAISMCKQLLYDLNNKWSFEEAKLKTAELIAQLRQSPEGQEGMDAFLNKRTPNWMKK